MRYKQDLAEFIPIADGARLIQERSGISEDEAREDIVLAVRERALESQWWCTSRGERSRRFRDDLPHGFLDNLAPDLIDWERSIARRRGLGAQFKVEIEVSRAGVCRLCLALTGAEDRNDERPELKQEAEPQENSIAAPGGRREATAAQKRQRPQGGRRPASQSETQKVWDEYDKIAKPELLTFARGELTRIASDIADKTGYKSNTVEKLIRSEYREKEEKRQNT